MKKEDVMTKVLDCLEKKSISGIEELVDWIMDERKKEYDRGMESYRKWTIHQ